MVGLKETSDNVQENDGSIEVCTVIVSQDCFIDFNFIIRFSTYDISAGTCYDTLVFVL